MRRPSVRSRSLVSKKRDPSSNSPTPHLEDYIVQLEKRDMSITSVANNDSLSKTASSPEPIDVYSQLAHKEQDLILAAELGKALLERNEELTRANERITEEYSAKLEVRQHFSYSIFSCLSSSPSYTS